MVDVTQRLTERIVSLQDVVVEVCASPSVYATTVMLCCCMAVDFVCTIVYLVQLTVLT